MAEQKKRKRGRLFCSFLLAFAGFLSGAAVASTSNLQPETENQSQVLTGVVFVNRVYFREETLREMMAHPVPGPLNAELLAADAETFARELQQRGFLHAKVSVRVRPDPRGQKLGQFLFNVGERAPLKEVRINGNVRVPEGKFTPHLFAKEEHPLGWLTQAGLFHRPYLNDDSQRILRVFYEHGFLESQVLGHRVAASSGKDWISLSFDVSEGPQYLLQEVGLAGELPGQTRIDAFSESMKPLQGKAVNLIGLQQRLNKFLDVERDEGHAFAGVRLEIPNVSSRDDGDKDAAFRGVIQKGPVAHFGKVIIEGNRETKDFVIRRMLRFKPGERYSISSVRQSEASVKSLGYFSSVNISHEPLEGNPEKLLMRVTVREQPTWIANVAPAFVGNEGMVLFGIVAFNNFLGRGTRFSTTGQFSRLRQHFKLSYFEPRLLNTYHTLSAEVHRRQWGYPQFITQTVGGSSRVSWQLPKSFRLGTGLTGDLLNLKTPLEVKDDAAPLGVLQDVYRNVINLNLSRDTRNSRLLPTKGWLVSLGSRYAGPLTGSSEEMDWIEGKANLRGYFTGLWQITFKFNLLYARLWSLNDQVLPLSQRYFLGGFGSVRGFTPRSIASIGEAFGQDQVMIGGTQKFVQNTEIDFPMFRGNIFRGFIFLDAGNTFAENEPLWSAQDNAGVALPGGLFWSTGFGVVLKTPVLPFRFEWGLPLTRRPTDRSLDFFFGLGSAF